MRNESRAGLFLGCMALACLLLPAVTGCSTPDAAGPDAMVPAPAAGVATNEIMVGRIAQVNRRYSYVIIKCESLPVTGEDAVVYRKDKPVGKLHISGPARPPFVAADILDGRPQKEDAVKVIRTRKMEASPEAKE